MDKVEISEDKLRATYSKKEGGNMKVQCSVCGSELGHKFSYGDEEAKNDGCYYRAL